MRRSGPRSRAGNGSAQRQSLHLPIAKHTNETFRNAILFIATRVSIAFIDLDHSPTEHADIPNKRSDQSKVLKKEKAHESSNSQDNSNGHARSHFLYRTRHTCS